MKTGDVMIAIVAIDHMQREDRHGLGYQNRCGVICIDDFSYKVKKWQSHWIFNFETLFAWPCLNTLSCLCASLVLQKKWTYSDLYENHKMRQPFLSLGKEFYDPYYNNADSVWWVILKVSCPSMVSNSSFNGAFHSLLLLL